MEEACNADAAMPRALPVFSWDIKRGEAPPPLPSCKYSSPLSVLVQVRQPSGVSGRQWKAVEGGGRLV